MTVRIQTAVHADHPRDIGRPRWEYNRLLPEGRELTFAVGDAVLVFSEPAVMWLQRMLAAMLDQEPEQRSQAAR